MTSELRRRMDAFSKRNQTIKQGARLLAYSRMAEVLMQGVGLVQVCDLAARVAADTATAADHEVLATLNTDDLAVVGLTSAEFLGEVAAAVQYGNESF